MPSGLQHRAVLRNPAVLINTASVSRNLRNDVLDRNITLRYNQTAKDANISEERGIKMFNKSIIKKAAAIAAVILAVTAFPFNIAKADTQTSGSTVSQTTSEYKEIRTASELVEAAKSASGNYKLMTDIDMTGVEWTPWDFSGTFDGNGHSNLSVKTVSKKTMKTYDGNRKEYETYGAGFFGVLTGAKVTGLNIYGARIEISTTEPCFAAPIAGLADDSDISDCIIKDTYVSLTDSAKMWGTGGIAGFGSGNLDNITTDVTLVCVDTDAAVRDEQFMGGAYAAGFLNIRNCSITIDGYDSDHGYVHDGGLVGMYMVYPLELSKTYQGEVLNNKVKGMITFFEDNTDRRAYCQANMGEVMNWTYAYSGFTSDFKRNETYDYSVTLLPEMCSNPSYTDVVTEATASDFGHTTHTCKTCGYTYSDTYTIHEHKVDNYSVVKEAASTDKKDGIEAGTCSLCNQTVYREYAANVVTDDITQAADNKVSDAKGINESTAVFVVIIAVIVVVIIITVVMMVQNNKRKRRHNRRRR